MCNLLSHEPPLTLSSYLQHSNTSTNHEMPVQCVTHYFHDLKVPLQVGSSLPPAVVPWLFLRSGTQGSFCLWRTPPAQRLSWRVSCDCIAEAETSLRRTWWCPWSGRCSRVCCDRSNSRYSQSPPERRRCPSRASCKGKPVILKYIRVSVFVNIRVHGFRPFVISQFKSIVLTFRDWIRRMRPRGWWVGSRNQWRTQDFFSEGFSKFGWGQRTERTGIWGR